MEARTSIIMPDRTWPGQTTPAQPAVVDQGRCDKYATESTETKIKPKIKPKIKLSNKGAIIGTWNVRTLYACGKLKELTYALEEYEWDIVGLSEVRWTGCGEVLTEEGHKLWYSGHDSLHRHGVGILVNKRISKSILFCTPVSERIISMRVAAQPMNISIIQVYAPTSSYSDEELEEFYGELEEEMEKIPRGDYIVVTGDWNAKIGPGAYETWAGTVGKFGLGETNDRGVRLLEFARTKELTLANTLFPHKDSRRVTWCSPSGDTRNQIDFILAPTRYKSSINTARTRSFPGADMGTDHNLVLMTTKLKLKSIAKRASPRIKFDLEKLKDPSIARVFEAKVGSEYAALNMIPEDVDSLTDNMSKVLFDTAREVLGKKRKKNRPWVTDEILDLCSTRKKLKSEKDRNLGAREQYRMVNNRIRREMRSAKEKWIEDQCAELDSHMRDGKSRLAFQAIKKLTNRKIAPVTAVEDKNGELITKDEEVLERWSEYCEELYNYNIEPDQRMLNDLICSGESHDAPIMSSEVRRAISDLKKNKSPGIDEVPAELIQHGGQVVVDHYTSLCQKIYQTKEWPKKWTQSLIIKLPKKGNTKKCENNRTISLICHASKILLKIIQNRIKTKTE